MREPILEPFLRNMRLRRVKAFVRDLHFPTLLDIGCGWEARLLKELEPYLSKGVGIDFKAPSIVTEKLETKAVVLEKNLPFPSANFDIVTMVAVLEHFDYPENILGEISRILKPGGSLVITVPSCYAKPVLEFLSFRLKIISSDEIRDHKLYYNRENLYALIDNIPELFIKIHCYFQWKFNNFLVVQKEGVSSCLSAK
jgi:SAM-dependent methyltransferase